MALLAAAPAWSASAPAPAPRDGDVGERLKGVERAIEEGRREGQRLKREAEQAEIELAKSRRQRVAAAAAIQDHEAEVSRLEEAVAELGRAEAAARARLRQRQDQFARVLTALERLARLPPEALIAQPLAPPDLVRSAILLRAAVPEIEQRAAELRGDLAELARTRGETDRRRGELAAATADLERERGRLDGLIRNQTEFHGRTFAETREAERRVRELSREAADLRELMSRLEHERLEREKQADQDAAGKTTTGAGTAAPANSRAISEARGTLPFPAVGRIIGHYGQLTETGMTRRGIVIETRKGAQVIAPYDGLVVFAGPFRGYGQLLIIEHGEGYHSLLAGLTRIDSAIGKWVVAGEPVGLMEEANGDKPALYVELRRNGQSINPLPWLAAQKSKVSG